MTDWQLGLVIDTLDAAHQPWVLPGGTECRTCGISGSDAHYLLNGEWPCDTAVLIGLVRARGVIGCDGQHGPDGMGCEDPKHCEVMVPA